MYVIWKYVSDLLAGAENPEHEGKVVDKTKDSPPRASTVCPHSTPVDLGAITTTNDVVGVTEKLIEPPDDPIVKVNGNKNIQ